MRMSPTPRWEAKTEYPRYEIGDAEDVRKYILSRPIYYFMVVTKEDLPVGSFLTSWFADLTEPEQLTFCRMMISTRDYHEALGRKGE